MKVLLFLLRGVRIALLSWALFMTFVALAAPRGLGVSILDALLAVVALVPVWHAIRFLEQRPADGRAPTR